MIPLAKFSIVVFFSIGIGLLCALGLVRFTEVDELQRPMSQVFILGIFLILAYKAGWVDLASQAWAGDQKQTKLSRRVMRLGVFCLLGIALGVLMRLAIQGGILVPLKFLSPEIYSAESRDLVALWQKSEGFSLGQLALFAMGATREEIMYRFVILGAMLQFFSPLRAVVFSSLIFAAVHLNPVTFISGIIFACVFIIFRSLLMISVMHTSANVWHTVVAKFDLVPEGVNPTDILDSPYGMVLVGSAIILLITSFSVSVICLKNNTDNKDRNLALRGSKDFAQPKRII